MSTLSVQLYSVMDQLAADQNATLERLAALGFRYAEPFGLGSPSRSRAQRLEAARELRAGLDAAGLTVSAAHVAVPDTVAELAEECAIVGADTVFVPHPKLVPGFDAETFGDIGRVDAFADALGSLAREAADFGLRVGYHNHWFEWTQLPDGRTGYDRFWSRTGDELLAEIDVYWAVAAGADPVQVLAELGDRVVAVHVKDGPATQGEPQTPLGTGAVDVQAALKGTQIPWHVMEIDLTELDRYELLGANARFLVETGLSDWS
jgi:sugar phosphate isomerase/epimerase